MLSRITQLKNKESGFTLIELLIVVVIIGILAAVAVPLYARYINISRAGEAPQIMTALIEYCRSYEAAKGSFPADDFIDEFTPGAGKNGAYFVYSLSGNVIQAAGLGNDGIIATDTLAYDLSARTWASNGVTMDSVRPKNPPAL